MNAGGYTESEAALVDAVKELVREQGLAKTTVLQISQRANLNRKTFYKHFRDKYELVNWICYREWSERESDTGLKDDWAFVLSILTFFESDRKFYGAALEDNGQNSFGMYIVENIAEAIRSSCADMFRFFGIAEDSIVRISFQLARMFRESMVYWLLHQDGKTSVEFFVDVETEANAFAALICDYNKYAGLECFCNKPGLPHFTAEKLDNVKLKPESEIEDREFLHPKDL